MVMQGCFGISNKCLTLEWVISKSVSAEKLVSILSVLFSGFASHEGCEQSWLWNSREFLFFFPAGFSATFAHLPLTLPWAVPGKISSLLLCVIHLSVHHVPLVLDCMCTPPSGTRQGLHVCFSKSHRSTRTSLHYGSVCTFNWLSDIPHWYFRLIKSQTELSFYVNSVAEFALSTGAWSWLPVSTMAHIFLISQDFGMSRPPLHFPSNSWPNLTRTLEHLPRTDCAPLYKIQL